MCAPKLMSNAAYLTYRVLETTLGSYLICNPIAYKYLEALWNFYSLLDVSLVL